MSQAWFWVVFVLVALTLVPSLLYYAAYLAMKQEPLKQRAALFFRWAVLLFLLGVIYVVYQRLARTILEMF
jgi:hypothetical protein